MRYLYGDSVVCSVQYDFLHAFETFVDAAVHTVRLDQEIARITAKADAAADARERALEVVEEFHRKSMSALEKLYEEYNEPNVAVYARQVREHAETVVEEASNNCKLAKEKQAKEQEAEFSQRRSELSGHIERFLKTELVPVVNSTVSMRLVDGQNQLTAVLSHEGGIMTTFTLTTAQIPAWQSPVRVALLVPGIELQLGIRKSWITGSVARSAVNLDEFVIGGFEIGEDHAEIRLRKRPEQPDGFVFKLAREDGNLTVDVERSDEEGDRSANLDREERLQIEELWTALRKKVDDAVRLRGKLLNVSFDGTDLFESRRLRPFVGQVVKSIAPIVQEVVAHSPNPAELSMKVETGEGRREEIYVRREALVAKMDSLDDEGRAVFEPMGLAGEPLTSEDVDVQV